MYLATFHTYATINNTVLVEADSEIEALGVLEAAYPQQGLNVRSSRKVKFNDKGILVVFMGTSRHVEE